MYRPLNFSMADRINAAKLATNNKTDLSDIPTSIDATPGSTHLDTSSGNLDQASQMVNNEQSKANQGTSPEAQLGKTGSISDTTYNKPLAAEYPNELDPTVATPTPKNKTFTERLLDRQTASRLTDTDRTQTGPVATDYPKDQMADINRPYPETEGPTRPVTNPYTADNISHPNTNQPSADLLGSIPQNRPATKLGPRYGAPNTPKSFTPKVRSMPKPRMR
jgi:hypothetical protein